MKNAPADCVASWGLKLAFSLSLTVLVAFLLTKSTVSASKTSFHPKQARTVGLDMHNDIHMDSLVNRLMRMMMGRSRHFASIRPLHEDPEAEFRILAPAHQVKGRGLNATNRRRGSRSLAPQSQYCSISPRHTACRFTMNDQKGDGRCHSLIYKRGLNSTEIALILKLHNDIRRKVATGNELGQPPASDMAELTWDEEAASIAQIWANQCHGGVRDEVRDTVMSSPNRKPLANGQNFYSAVNWSHTGDFDLRIPINTWFARVDDFHPKGVFPDGPRENSDQYTQLVWAKTRRVGCGYLQNFVSFNLYCNYVTEGNDPDEPVYKVGYACTACPRDLPKCKKGLCAA